jgi:hypothetical protein
MNRLWGMRAYTCGSMDYAKDGGVGWRQLVADWLTKRGVVVLDPTNKPTSLGVESPEIRDHWKKLRAEGRYEELAAAIKVIRGIDLRMVDISDFLVVYLDREQWPCGTWEELFLANREKKSVLIVSPHEHSFWLYGTVPHQHLFHDWDSLFKYLHYIDTAENVELLRRWCFFDLLPPTPEKTT